MEKLHINTSRPYDVYIGDGLLRSVGELAASLSGSGRAVIVCGESVFPLYGEKLGKSLESAGFEVLFFIHESGEQAKNLDSYSRLVGFLCDNSISRTDALFALGGGVTGDLTGFAAATYRRGITYFQLPTTLLAAVDSSVGGKTGLDLVGGKNMVGAFYQPCAVFCDTGTLSTLSERDYRCGCAEIVKYAVMGDAELFRELEAHGIRGHEEKLIAQCVCMKRGIVEKDEFDTGDRRLLNLGHTLGHAAEKLSGYTVSHGEAVAAGLAAVMRAAVKNGICAGSELMRVLSLLKRLGLPTEPGFSPEELANAAMSDKKTAHGKIHLIVPERIGSCRIIPMTPDELRSFIS